MTQPKNENQKPSQPTKKQLDLIHAGEFGEAQKAGCTLSKRKMTAIFIDNRDKNKA